MKKQYYSSSGVLIGVMEYGFDTDFIDEDYTNTRGYSQYKSTAAIQKGTAAVLWGEQKMPGYLSTKNVNHTIDDVAYYIELDW